MLPFALFVALIVPAIAAVTTWRRAGMRGLRDRALAIGVWAVVLTGMALLMSAAADNARQWEIEAGVFVASSILSIAQARRPGRSTAARRGFIGLSAAFLVFAALTVALKV